MVKVPISIVGVSPIFGTLYMLHRSVDGVFDGVSLSLTCGIALVLYSFLGRYNMELQTIEMHVELKLLLFSLGNNNSGLQIPPSNGSFLTLQAFCLKALTANGSGILDCCTAKASSVHVCAYRRPWTMFRCSGTENLNFLANKARG